MNSYPIGIPQWTEFNRIQLAKYKSSYFTSQNSKIVFFKSTNQQPILLDTLPTMVEDDRDDDGDIHDVGDGDDGDEYDEDIKWCWW